MAALTITASRVALVLTDTNYQKTRPAAAAITAGQLVQENSAGKWALLDTTTGTGTTRNLGVAIQSVATGEALTCATDKAVVDLGDALDALAYGALLYGSETAGAIDTAVSATTGAANIRIGKVTAGWGSTTPDKLLELDFGEIAIA